MSKRPSLFVRDLSWLSFNARVLQEAKDPTVHIYDRLRFLGIFSNNLDEFFRVRVATLSRMARLGKGAKVHLENNPEVILEQIQKQVITQQVEFDQIYADVIKDMEQHQLRLRTETELDEAQQQFVKNYFNEKVRTEIVPLMVESIPQLLDIQDKSIYLACVMGHAEESTLRRYALIEVPTAVLPRFVILPPSAGYQDVMLLEDIIRFNLPTLFAAFGFNRFFSAIIKITRDAELDLDTDLSLNVIDVLTKGLKNRKKGRATRFVFDREIDPLLFQYLIKKLGLSKHDYLIPGGRIHNFKDFMDFPRQVFKGLPAKPAPIAHPDLVQPCLIMDVLDKKDVLLHFPYHSFDAVVDFIREAAIDPLVFEIKITAYRLAKNSRIINALINAVRNGKQVSVILELKARFDEEANMYWKAKLEEAGVQVFLGVPDMKVHAKLGLIKKREFDKNKQYAFIATGNLNESTARFYGDHCLLTSSKELTKDVSRVFAALERPKPDLNLLQECKSLLVSPQHMRQHFLQLINNEIKQAQLGKEAFIMLKLNSLADPTLIQKLYEAAHEGVKIDLIVRGICCALTQTSYTKENLYGVSIVDENLEHARVIVFHNNGKTLVYISSADWMVRNLDHRIEAAVPITNEAQQRQLIDILQLQLADNVKARWIDNEQSNRYVTRHSEEPTLRSQQEIYNYITLQATSAKL